MHIDEDRVKAEIARLRGAREQIVEADNVALAVLTRNVEYVQLTAQIKRLEWVLQLEPDDQQENEARFEGDD